MNIRKKGFTVNILAIACFTILLNGSCSSKPTAQSTKPIAIPRAECIIEDSIENRVYTIPSVSDTTSRTVPPISHLHPMQQRSVEAKVHSSTKQMVRVHSEPVITRNTANILSTPSQPPVVDTSKTPLQDEKSSPEPPPPPPVPEDEGVTVFSRGDEYKEMKAYIMEKIWESIWQTFLHPHDDQRMQAVKETPPALPIMQGEQSNKTGDSFDHAVKNKTNVTPHENIGKNVPPQLIPPWEEPYDDTPSVIWFKHHNEKRDTRERALWPLFS